MLELTTIRRRRVALVGLAATLLLLLGGALSGGRVMAASPTVVSLTFDDGRATQYVGRSILASYGMHATFYVNSPLLGSSTFYMTWQQLHGLYADGNEVGGHTAYHADLPQIDPTEAQRQICDDRVNLLNHGYQPTDFAYPYGDYSVAVESMAQNCGYNSARSTDSLGGAVAESMPPQNLYAVRAVSGSTSLASMENAVTNAEQNGGGWLPIVFHDICNGCSSVSTTQADFTAFLTWLQQESSNGVTVQTVQQVIGGALQPAVPGPALPAAPSGSNPLRNSSLELNTLAGAAPDCTQFDHAGNNSFNWTRTTNSHSGSYAEWVSVTSYTDGDNKLLVRQDLGHCTPTVTPGHQYRLSTWYQSTVTPFFTVFSRDNQYAFSYWTASPNFTTASSWTLATWVTPPIPNNVNGLSFGLALDSTGSLTVDDMAIVDAAATPIVDTTPPAVSIAAPAAGTTVSGTVGIAATASDNVMVDHVDFLVDGSLVGSLLPPENGPTTFSWNSHSIANGNHTLKARAVDTAGNTTTSSGVTVFVGNQTTNLLQNPSLESPASNTVPTCWLLGGYGTNSYSWTHTSDAHTGSYAETVNISSYTSGDRKLVNAQDSGSCAPAVTAGHTYTVGAWYKSSVQAYFFAYYRNSSGSWVFWANSARFSGISSWTQASWTTPALPSGATLISVGLGADAVGSVTMDDFSLFDNAPQPDQVAPTSAISCNNGALEGTCASFYSGPVQVTLTATDNPGGSGVGSIRYTTDGTDPSPTNGTAYAGPFSVTASGTTIKYRAYDNAGNAEPVKSQLIRIDTTAPVSTISCNGVACPGASYNAAVSVTLAATDQGGSGVRAIYYTTDGSVPSTSNGNAYLGSFSVTSTETVNYRAYDNAGNAEAVNSQSIQIDTTAPTSTISCNGTTCTSSFYNSAVSVTLAASDNPAGSGLAAVVYTTDGSDPSLTNGTTYSSTVVLGATTTVKYRAYDNAGNAEPVNSRLIQIDTTAPASTIACDGDTCADGYYNSAVSVSLSATDNAGGASVASIRYTTDGSDPTVTNGNLYGGAFSLAATTTVKYRSYDNAGNAEPVNSQLIQIETTAPTVTLTSPADGATVSGTITLGASASDNVAIDHVDFLVDGHPVGSVSAAPYNLSWDSRSVSDGAHTVQANAENAAGNEASSAIASITVQNTADSTPPASAISCNGASCAGSFYNGAVSITLTASDNPGGSGVASIRYTTDGTDPSLLNGTIYSGAFSLAATTTVKYAAYDNAGNAEPVNTQLIQIDTTAPSSTISCNNGACASSYYTSAVSVTLSATDNAGGSGVASIRYTTDGTVPSLTNGNTYSGAFSLAATATVEYRAVDNAGNAEPVNAASISVDTTAPASTIRCNAAACSSGYYQPGVLISLSATDAGSGVASIRYTTDGTDPTLTNGSTYTGSFVLSVTLTVKYRAYDNVGNVEPLNSQVVQIDGTPPSVSVTNPAAGAVVTGSINLTAAASDNVTVAHVDFLVDGKTVGSVSTAPYVLSWTSQSVGDGPHTVAARAVDEAGNSTTSGSTSVTVANSNLLPNPSLETTGANNVPSCWLLGGYGTNSYSWSHTTDAHSGTYAENLTITSYSTGDRKLVTTQDSGSCAPAVTAGHTYTLSAWYKSNVQVYFFAYYRNSSGAWVFWANSPKFAPSASWTQASWSTPAVPGGATLISVGMGTDVVGSLTMDDFGLFATG